MTHFFELSPSQRRRVLRSPNPLKQIDEFRAKRKPDPDPQVEAVTSFLRVLEQAGRLSSDEVRAAALRLGLEPRESVTRRCQLMKTIATCDVKELRRLVLVKA